MPWPDDYTVERLTCADPATPAYSSPIYLNPGEKIHIVGIRVDGAYNDGWLLYIEGAVDPDGDEWCEDPPDLPFRMTAIQTHRGIYLEGPYCFRARVENDSGSTDTPIVDLTYRKDGVHLR